MAATKNTMSDISSKNSTYHATSIDEPTLDSISFQESLRFFQEQLIINNTQFTSPSLTQMLNNDINIDFSDEENNKQMNDSNSTYEYEEVHSSGKSSTISIPTVETILESVRVLRAIQRSQEKRGSTWALNMSQSESDMIENEEVNLSMFDNYDSEPDNKILTEAIRTCNYNDTDSCLTAERNSTIISSDVSESFWINASSKKEELISENYVNNNDKKLNISIADDEACSTNHVNKNNENGTANTSNEAVAALYTDSQIGQFEINAQVDTFDFISDITSLSNTISSKNMICQISENNFFLADNDINKINGCQKGNTSSDYESHQITSKKKSECCDCSNAALTVNTYDNSTHLRPESCSDTSSYYVSAECSPCNSLHNDLELSSQACDSILKYGSSLVNNETKKEAEHESWTTDSSGICINTFDHSETRKSNSSLSSTSTETNILDRSRTEERFSKEMITKENACNDMLRNEETHLVQQSIVLETPNSDEESYHSIPLSELKCTSPDFASNEVTYKENIFGIKDDFQLHNEEENTITHNSTTHDVNKITELKESETHETNKEIKCIGTDEKCYRSEDATAGTGNADRSKLHLDIEHQTSQQTITKNSSKETIIPKITSSSWNFEAIIESLYSLSTPVLTEILSPETTFQKEVVIESRGAFCNYPEGSYTLELQQHSLWILKENDVLFSMPLNDAEVIMERDVLNVDNKLGRCLYLKSKTPAELTELQEELHRHSIKNADLDSIKLVHYPIKSHRNVVVIDLGSCSTRAGILMDQPTLPFIFFPSVCATDKRTGNHVYGKEALQNDVRQCSNLSFPLRQSIKIVKHNIDVNLLEGLFKKIFLDLRVDPQQYSIQVCLPRTLSINAQNELVKLLLEDLKVQSVSLTHQALLTLYAHKVSTGIVVDVGDRMDILPVVDGFIVENGVTRLPYGGQRLIHHMKHALAEKHISLSNDVDSFVVQYISEKLTYIAEDYESESKIAVQYPESLKKSIALETFIRNTNCIQFATLEEARFQIPEGLFKPELWGLDSPGIHQLVQKAIQASSVDVRKKVAENIYISGGVTMTPGFVERLTKEVTHLNAPRINPKVIASNYRYHSTYIGACEFARMDVFPKVCLNAEEYNKSQISSLKKFVLCF